MKKTSLLTACSLIALGTVGACSGQAHAQSMDYGSLENLFGEPVTTSATGTPQKASDAAVNMTIITATEIRQAGSRNIPDILGRVPGLDIFQASATGFDVGVRGYQQAMQPSLLVLIDGRQVFQDDYSRTVWENLPVNVDDIRQIEVVLGPASALFGSNAAHGVVNIVTYSPSYDRNEVASISYGTQNSFQGDATVSGKLTDKIGYKLSLGGASGDEFKVARSVGLLGSTEAGLFYPQISHRYVTESNTFQITPDLQAFTEATFSSSKGNEAYYNSWMAAVADVTYSVRAGAAWQSPIGTLKLNSFLNHANVQNDEVSPSLPRYSDVSANYTTQIEDDFQIGSSTFRVSAEDFHKQFRLITNDPSPAPGIPAAASRITENNYAVGGMWLWPITNSLSMTTAARFDHLEIGEAGPLAYKEPYTSADFSHVINKPTGNWGLVYKPDAEDTIRAQASHGVETPSLLDYAFNTSTPLQAIAGYTTLRAGNPRLEATTSTNYELDYDRKLPSLNSVLKLAAFYEVNQDIIAPFMYMPALSTTTRTTFLQSENVGGSKAAGGEVELKGSSEGGLRWDVSYSFASVHDSNDVTRPPGNAANNWLGMRHSAPEHHVRALLGYTVGPWEFDVNSQYLSERSLFRNLSIQTSDPYFTVAARGAYSVTDNVTVALSGENLNSSKLTVSPYPQVERQARLTVTAKF